MAYLSHTYLGRALSAGLKIGRTGDLPVEGVFLDESADYWRGRIYRIIFSGSFAGNG